MNRDFIEIVASDFRPGLIKIGSNDFYLTVSVPVIQLANSIPARALMTWDRRLLSSSQHLVLLISGWNGVYSALNGDGTYNDTATKLGSKLKFSVGLCPQYKPGKVQAREACRTFGLVVDEAEDRLEREAAAARNPFDYSPDMDEDGDVSLEPEQEEPEPEDMGRFDKFALSSSLENLMNQSFLTLVQMRQSVSIHGRKVGWAGAEAMLAIANRLQVSTEYILADQQLVRRMSRFIDGMSADYGLPAERCHERRS